ncbi:MAG: hypothetical protein ACLRMZ_21945 [Blautia marasmi]
MQKIFTRYISYVVAVALLAILALNWGLQGRNARKQMVQNSALKLGQISQTIDNNEVELRNLKESLSEDYLTRAYAFAYIIEQNPSVLDSQQELERIAELLNVDELHVIDENGILFAGSIPLYFGMDFHTTDQTKNFSVSWMTRTPIWYRKYGPMVMNRKYSSISVWHARIRKVSCR